MREREVHRTFCPDEDEAIGLFRLAAQACRNSGSGKLAELKKEKDGWLIIITPPVEEEKAS